jgi:hypothetical protein
MKSMLLLFLLIIISCVISQCCESKQDSYKIGAHWNYSIVCENGFIYKSFGNRRGFIQIFNSDGTPLKCGHKIY